MKTLVLLFVLLIVSTSCQDSKLSSVRAYSTPSYYLNNTAIVADAVKKFQAAKSMTELSNYMRETYGIKNFGEVYNKFAPYLKGVKSIGTLKSSTTTKNSFLGWDGMLTSAGISKESKSYLYVKDMYTMLKNISTRDNSEVVPALKSMRDQLSNDKTISESERATLLSVSNMIIINYDGLVEALLNPNASHQHDSGARIEGFLDFIVSVLITIVVVAITVLAVAAVFVEIGWLAESEIIYGLGTWAEVDVYAAATIIGATVGAGDAIYQAYQGNCYTFRCGEDENIGLQDCGNGECEAI